MRIETPYDRQMARKAARSTQPVVRTVVQPQITRHSRNGTIYDTRGLRIRGTRAWDDREQLRKLSGASVLSFGDIGLSIATQPGRYTANLRQLPKSAAMKWSAMYGPLNHYSTKDVFDIPGTNQAN